MERPERAIQIMSKSGKAQRKFRSRIGFEVTQARTNSNRRMRSASPRRRSLRPLREGRRYLTLRIRLNCEEPHEDLRPACTSNLARTAGDRCGLEAPAYMEILFCHRNNLHIEWLQEWLELQALASHNRGAGKPHEFAASKASTQAQYYRWQLTTSICLGNSSLT